jgi:hypothetical protein
MIVSASDWQERNEILMGIYLSLANYETKKEMG